MDQLTADFRRQLAGLLSTEERWRNNPVASVGKVGRINRAVTWGLILCGACLMLGLFSRIAAVGAATMLLLFYLAMPPWPGLSATTVGGAHYLYVNNNIIEALAALVLASSNSGRWTGLDAVVQPALAALFRLGRREA